MSPDEPQPSGFGKGEPGVYELSTPHCGGEVLPSSVSFTFSIGMPSQVNRALSRRADHLLGRDRPKDLEAAARYRADRAARKSAEFAKRQPKDTP